MIAGVEHASLSHQGLSDLWLTTNKLCLCLTHKYSTRVWMIASVEHASLSHQGLSVLWLINFKLCSCLTHKYQTRV
jgi:hypothetical protein